MSRSTHGAAVTACLLLLVVCSPLAAETSYTEEMFRNAIDRDYGIERRSDRSARTDPSLVTYRTSMSPLFVLIRTGDTENRVREVCTLTSYLMGAIAEERGLKLGSDQQKILDIVMATPNRLFTFRNPKAIRNIAPLCSEQQLVEVRRLLNAESAEKLRKSATADLSKSPDQQSEVTKIYRRLRGKQFWSSDSYMFAVAHVLLGRGVQVGLSHGSGALYVEGQE